MSLSSLFRCSICWLVFSSVCPTGTWAQNRSAQIIGNCRSLSLAPVGAVSALHAVDQYFTTSDGRRGVPQNILNAGGVYLFSGEFKPVSGAPGLYAADYVTFSWGQVADWGSVTVALPTVDADGNGMPDITQRSSGVLNAPVTGHVVSDAVADQADLSGTISRSPGKTIGTYSVSINGLTFDGVAAVPYVEGVVSYDRSQSTMSMTLTFTSPNGQTRQMSGQTQYQILDSDTVRLPPCVIQSGAISFTTSSVTLKRRGTAYRGEVQFSDGDPTTSWVDYEQWVIEISDLNDADGNGTPDFSDALPVRPSISTQPLSQTVVAGSEVRLRVVAVGTPPLRYSWQLNGQDIAGANGETLVLSRVQSPQAGSYRVVISNSAGTVTSAVANVTITPLPSLGACVPTPSDLVGWWPGDGTLVDVQSGKNALATGNLNFKQGKVGQAFNFDGTNSFVETSIGLLATDDWSMAAWTFWRGPSQAKGQKAETIIYHGEGDRNGYGLFIIGAGWCEEFPFLCPHLGEMTILYGGVAWHFPGIKLDQNSWTHVVLSRHEGVAKLYRNGQLVWSQATPAPVSPSSKFDISNWPPASFNGMIDEVGVFDGSLTDEFVQSLYLAGEYGMCKTATSLRVKRPQDGTILFSVSGPKGQSVDILTSTDLVRWELYLRMPNATGSGQFSEANVRATQRRYFRLTPTN